MDPGARRDLVRVYRRTLTPNADGLGHEHTLELVGSYWCTLYEVTRSTFYSGDEKLVNPNLYLLQTGIRIVFETHERFNTDNIEFHVGDAVYIPRDSGIRLGSSANTKFSYNCKEQKAREAL